MSIIVTGANSFLAKSLLPEIQDLPIIPLFGRKDCNLLDSLETQARFEQMKAWHSPDTLLMIASQVGGIGLNMEKPADLMYQNLEMSMNCLMAAKDIGIKRVVLIGTICSYPHVPANIPFIESDLFTGKPDYSNRPYGNAKLAIMEMLCALERQYGIRHQTLMLANMYGEHDNFNDNSSHVIPALIKKFLKAKQENLPSVECWGTGTATRDFLYVKDAARAISMVLRSDMRDNIYNVGTGIETSIKQLSETIAGIVGYDSEIRWLKDKSDGQPRRVLCIDKIRNELGWSPKVSLQEGLEATIKWYKEQNV